MEPNLVPIELLETALLRMAYNNDREKFERLIPPAIDARVERPLQPIAEPLLIAAGLTDTVAFLNAFYGSSQPL